jgi:hypothetical protein
MAIGMLHHLREPSGVAGLLLASLVLLPAPAAAQTGTVTGTVRNAATMQPVANVTVVVYSPDVRVQVLGATNAAGAFSIAGVPPGNYFAIAIPVLSTGLVWEVFPDAQCFSTCSTLEEFTGGTPFAVTAGGTTANRNFNLDVGGAISGTLTRADNGTPIQNAVVTIFAKVGTSFFSVAAASTDAAGDYLVSRLAPGAYYATTSNSLGFVNETYNNIPCVGSCSANSLLAGAPIAVTAGATTAGRNFALDTGGRLTGSVTSAAGAALQNVSVSVVTMISGSVVTAGSAATDATGTYTVTGLPAGTYHAFTTNNLGFMNEIYDDLLCPRTCSSTTAAQSGADIPIALGGTTSGRNFVLGQGGNISGTVLDQVTAAPLTGIAITAVVTVGTTNFTASATTDAAGNYTIVGLPTGSYRLYTSGAGQFIHEIYDNQQCRGPCSTASAAAIGSPVAVTAGATTTGHNFALQRGGSVSGTVVDSTTGLPVPSVLVSAFAVVGGSLTQIGFDFTNSMGVYEVQGLMGGAYFLATSGNHSWRNEVYDNIPCIGPTCSIALLATGAPVQVAVGATTAGRDFSLGQGDLVQGRITEATSGDPIAGAFVILVHSPSATIVGQVASGPGGVYTFGGVANGTYVAYTSNSVGYFNEIYNNIRCATNCSVATALAAGTPIQVTAAAADGIDRPSLVLANNFALDVRNEPPGAPTGFRASVANGTAQFSWTPPTPSTTGVVTSYVIDAGVSPGGTILSIPVTGTSHSTSGVPPGVFYVRVRAINAFGSSPPSTEVVLVVGTGSTALPETPTGVTAFMSGGRLTLTWAAALGGGPSSSFFVEAGSASGAANLATLSVSGRSLTFVPVPNGFYFLRVRAANAAGVSPPSVEVMIVVGNVASPPGAPNFSSASLSGSTVTLTWQAPVFGTATSYIIEAGSASGLSNLAVYNTGTSSLTASFSGVPKGTYYVRIRAANAIGASVVSNERTIVVP